MMIASLPDGNGPKNFLLYNTNSRNKVDPCPIGNEDNKIYKPNYNYSLVWYLRKPTNLVDYELFKALLMEKCFPKDYKDNIYIPTMRSCQGGNLGVEILSTEPIGLSDLGYIETLCHIAEGKPVRKINELKTGLAKYYEENPIEKPKAKIRVPANWIDRTKGRCPLLEAWIEQDNLSDVQLLMLISNIRYIKRKDTSINIIDDFLSGRNDLSDKEKERIRKFSKIKTLIPRHKIVNCEEDCRMTIPEFFHKHYDKTLMLNQEWKCSLQELDKWMDDNLIKSMKENPYLYFKSQTASGKTHRIIQFYKQEYENNTLGKQILAVPTHTLAEEVEKRIHAAAPDTPVFRIPEITDYTKKELTRLNAGLHAQHYDTERSRILSLLLGDTEGVFILTHSMLIHLEKAVEYATRIIIDENIEEALITNIYLSKSSLGAIGAYCGYIPAVNNIKQAIQYIYDNCLEEYLEDEYQIPNLFSVLKAEQIKPTKDGGIRALVKAPLITTAIKNNIPIALFTATPLSVLLKIYYGYDFMIAEAPFARNTGTITQYCGVSGARGNNNERLPGYVKYINSKIPAERKKDYLLISFLGSEGMWEREGFIVATVDDKKVHLRNSAGLDCFNGKDLIVVGKFDLPDEYYFNLWEDLGLEDEPKPHRIMQSVDRNGIKQNLYLWSNPILREQQLEYMEYATAQAVGRARSLRKDADVLLFSNYIISDVDTVIFD